ncbi:hypothetical protein PRIPAC_97399, partial [Pristionchus pacificus]|uniref:Trypsin n=1 Tax=Pristionchus pacificus TaxID=54126 RepID=A0A2A6D2L8_PRIPA
WFGTCTYQGAGAIIDNNWVVTTYSAISLAVGTTSLRVRAGTITHDKNGQFVKVREIKRPGDGSDIALLHLDAPLIFGDFTQPICLPSYDADVVQAGGRGWFTSWGHSSPTSITTETYLQEGELNISDNSVCDEFIVGKTKPETQLCAGGFYVTGGTATCKYDMGGPLMQKRGDTWYLFGLSSTVNYEFSTCKQNTVFTRVEGFCDWFSTTTGIACLN